MRISYAFMFCVIVVLALLIPSPAAAQITGTILGTVQDKGGAAVSGALVTIENRAIGLSRSARTSDQGDYAFPALPVGTYIVKVQANGFAPYESTPFAIVLNQEARVDITVTIGSVEQSIEVNAAIPIVDTTTSTLGEVMAEDEVVGLPLNGRNFLQLATLQPGVTPATVQYQPSSGSKLLNEMAQTTSQVNGLRIQSNNYQIDGGDDNEPFYGFIAAVPDPDAIEEFKILTNAYSAEFGRASGGVVNVITRSGTNGLHGDLFEFLRNDALDARNFFDVNKSSLKQNQFGASAGGPIVKNKVFFFGNYEGLRRTQGTTQNVGVPTALEREGNFSQSSAKPIDPTTGMPFPGDTIPSTRISTVANSLLQFYPLPNSGANQYVSSLSGPETGNQFLAKVDQSVGTRDRISYDYQYRNLSLTDPNPVTIYGAIGVPGFGTKDQGTFNRAIISETHTFGLNTVNIARFTFNRTVLNSGLPITEHNRFDYGFTYPSRQLNDLPTIGITGLSTFGLTSAADFFRTDNVFQGSDDLSITKGRHNFKMGAEVLRLQLRDSAIAFDSGGFDFTGFATGNAFADFLLGDPLYILQLSGSTLRYWYSTQVSAYFQDDYRVSHNLTINLGLRYDVFSPFHELHDRAIAFRPGQTSQTIPNLPTGLLVVGDPGISNSTIRTRYNNLGPRVGFSWDVFGNGRTSLRGAYGIFYDDVAGFTPFQLVLYPGLNLSQFIFAPPSFADPYQGHSPFAGTGPLPYNLPQQFNPLDPNFQTPYAQQWNLTVQHELAKNYLFQIGYVGTRGEHLVQTHELNDAQYVPGNTNPGNVQSRRPYPQFAGIFNNETSAWSTYHSLQAEVKHDFAHGFSFLAGYTFSRTIDIASVIQPFYGAVGQPQFAQNPNDLTAEKGLAAFDVRNRFVLSGLWEIPVTTENAWVAKALGHWTLTTILSAQSGNPFTIVDSANPSENGSGGISDRPNFVSGCNLGTPSGANMVHAEFNTSCFVPVVAGSGLYGTAGRNIVIGPGLFNMDLGLIKKIPIREHYALEFRAEAFNILNHPNFEIPVNDIRSPLFGQILSTLPDSQREIQFALKLQF